LANLGRRRVVGIDVDAVDNRRRLVQLSAWEKKLRDRA